MDETKSYLISGVSFKLKPFERYSKNQELKIKKLLGITDEDNTINVQTSDNNEIFPLLLTPEDDAFDITKFDFNDMEYGQISEVIIDWAFARVFFIQNMPNYFANLLEKRIQQIGNTQANSEKAEASNLN